MTKKHIKSVNKMKKICKIKENYIIIYKIKTSRFLKVKFKSKSNLIKLGKISLKTKGMIKGCYIFKTTI